MGINLMSMTVIALILSAIYCVIILLLYRHDKKGGEYRRLRKVRKKNAEDPQLYVYMKVKDRLLERFITLGEGLTGYFGVIGVYFGYKRWILIPCLAILLILWIADIKVLKRTVCTDKEL